MQRSREGIVKRVVSKGSSHRKKSLPALRLETSKLLERDLAVFYISVSLSLNFLKDFENKIPHFCWLAHADMSNFLSRAALRPIQAPGNIRNTPGSNLVAPYKDYTIPRLPEYMSLRPNWLPRPLSRKRVCHPPGRGGG
jgi:hypothetical protein